MTKHWAFLLGNRSVHGDDIEYNDDDYDDYDDDGDGDDDYDLDHSRHHHYLVKSAQWAGRLICVSAAVSDAMLSDRLLCSQHQNGDDDDDANDADGDLEDDDGDDDGDLEDDDV